MWVLVAGIAGSGYWVFIKNRETTEQTVTTSAENGDTQVIKIGFEITRTRKELDDLRQSVAISKNIFNTPSFKNLEDLSVAILPEKITKRENPFMATEWKARAEKQLAPNTVAQPSGGMQTSTSTQSLTGN